MNGFAGLGLVGIFLSSAGIMKVMKRVEERVRREGGRG